MLRKRLDYTLHRKVPTDGDTSSLVCGEGSTHVVRKVSTFLETPTTVRGYSPFKFHLYKKDMVYREEWL